MAQKLKNMISGPKTEKKNVLKIEGNFRLKLLSAPTKCQQPVRTSLPFLPSGSSESPTPPSAEGASCPDGWVGGWESKGSFDFPHFIVYIQEKCVDSKYGVKVVYGSYIRSYEHSKYQN